MLPEDQFLGQAPLHVPALVAELESVNAENVLVLQGYHVMFRTSKRKVNSRHPAFHAMCVDERFNGEAWGRLRTEEGWFERNTRSHEPGFFVSTVYRYIMHALMRPGAQFVVGEATIERAYLTSTEVQLLETGKKWLPVVDPVGHLRGEYDKRARRSGPEPSDVSLEQVVTWKIPDSEKRLLVQRIFAESISLLHSCHRQVNKSAGEYQQHFNRQNLPRLSAKQKAGSNATELPRGFFG